MFVLYFIAFVAGFCLMVIEIVAGRLVAPYLGAHIYSWTSIIGVVLAGIALGNFAGGYLADRKNPRALLSFGLFGAGFTSLLSIILVQRLGPVLSQISFSLPLATLALSLAAFFLPSFFFGTITPILIKLALKDLNQTGQIAGKLYGIGTAGSILGTFTTGFLLITTFGTRQIIITVAVILVLLAVIAAIRQGRPLPKSLILIVLVTLAFFSLIPFVKSAPCIKESRYYCINIAPANTDGSVYLLLDRTTQTILYPNNPQKLGSEYYRVFALFADYIAKRGIPRPKILFIGGGGYAVPKYLTLKRPEFQVEVVEIDPGTTEVVESRFGKLDFPIHHTDARVYLQSLAEDEKYDLILGDAYQDYVVPFQLTTEEFTAELAGHLSENGIYAINVVDSYANGKLLASMVKTMQEVFPYVEVLARGDRWKTYRQANHVLVGSRDKIDRALWVELQSSSPAPRSGRLDFLADEEVNQFLKWRGAVLTDNFAPVENMLGAEFFLKRYNK